MKNREKLSGVHFVDLLNDVALTVPSGGLRDQDKLRIQILLLHLYVDYLMITILEKISPPRKNKYKTLKGRNPDSYWRRLKLLRLRRTLDADGYKALKWLNDMRNIIAHEYDFKMKDIENILWKIKEKFGLIISPSFTQANLEGKLSLACMLYINALRQHILKKLGFATSDVIRVVPDKRIIKYVWLGKK